MPSGDHHVRTGSLRDRLSGRDHNLLSFVARSEHGVLEAIIPRLSNLANYSQDGNNKILGALDGLLAKIEAEGRE